MTPEEILRDLRDIHLPDQGADAAGAGIVWWPVLLVVILVLLSVALAWRRRSAWRREIARHLDAIEKDADRGRTREAWTALAVLLRRIAMTVEGRQHVAGLIGEPWLERLDRLFETDAFSHGPGRGVTVVPYGGRLDDERRASAPDWQPAPDQLKATIERVRRQLPRLGTAVPWN